MPIRKEVVSSSTSNNNNIKNNIMSSSSWRGVVVWILLSGDDVDDDYGLRLTTSIHTHIHMKLGINLRVNLTRMSASTRTRHAEPVYLNVYDLSPMNDYTYDVGIGFYSGVQVHGESGRLAPAASLPSSSAGSKCKISYKNTFGYS